MNSAHKPRLLLVLTTVLATFALLFGCDRGPMDPGSGAQGTASPSLETSDVEVNTCGMDTEVRLLAGQHIEVGTVRVGNDQNYLYVSFETAGDWKVTETHLAVGANREDIPTNNAGNPQIGHFPFENVHDPALTSHTYRIALQDLGLESEQIAYIAAHGNVIDSENREEGAWGEGDQLSDGQGNWAMYFPHRVQDCAVASIGVEGGIISTANGTVKLDIPEGSLSEVTEITVVQTSTQNQHTIDGSVFEFGPAGLEFDPPAILSVVIDKSTIPADIAMEELRLVYVIDESYEPIPGSGIDPSLSTPTTVTLVGEVLHFSTIGAAGTADDLELMMTATPDPVEAGTVLQHSLSVANPGPDDVTDLVVRLEVDEEVLVETATLPGGCSWINPPGVKVVDCDLGTLAAGADANLTVDMLPQTAGQTLSSTASILSWTGPTDPNLSNNSASETTDVVAAASADLALTMSVEPDPVTVHEDLTHTVVINNTGPEDVSDVEFGLVVTGDVLFASGGVPSDCSPLTSSDSKLFQCQLASLPAGSSQTLTMVVTPQTAGQTLESDADIVSWTGPSDPDLSNNSASETTDVVGAASGNFAYVANQGDGTVSVIDRDTDAVVTTIAVGSFPYGAAVSPDGSIVYVTNRGDGSISIIDVATHTVTGTIVSVASDPFAVEFGPDGSVAYVTDNGTGAVTVIDVPTHSVSTTITGLEAFVRGIAVNPGGTKAFVAASTSIHVLDLASNALATTISGFGNMRDVAIDSDGTKVFATDGTNDRVHVIDAGTETLTNSIDVGSGAHGIAFRSASATNSEEAYIANEDANSVSVLDVGMEAVTTSFPVSSGPFLLAITADGTKAYISQRDSSSVAVVDLATGTLTSTVGVGSSPAGIAVTP